MRAMYKFKFVYLCADKKMRDEKHNRPISAQASMFLSRDKKAFTLNYLIARNFARAAVAALCTGAYARQSKHCVPK